MKAYVFPGQGAQYIGMGKDLYENSTIGKTLFNKANRLLNFDISQIMFAGTNNDLKQTNVTQPAIFLHSVILTKIMGNKYRPDMTAGHSLGEFSALVAAHALSFNDGLQLVHKRATAMQKACETVSSTMAAIIGLHDKVIEEICDQIDEIVVAANYNCPGQIVISGSTKGIELACKALLDSGAKFAFPLKVRGAFHSPFMEPARAELELAIQDTEIKKPICPIFQNVNAKPETDPVTIKQNLVKQLTAPVRWTQTMKNMISGGCKSFTEIGPGKTLQGLIKRLDRHIKVDGIDTLIDI